MFKKSLKVILTNWVHIVGFYVTTCLTIVLFKATGLSNESESWTKDLLILPLSTLEVFLIYGPIIIGCFYGVLIILDILGLIVAKFDVRKVLLFECILLIPQFIVWAFQYRYWLWISLSLSFIITQFIRKAKLDKVLQSS
jgi:hypothetical protein